MNILNKKKTTTTTIKKTSKPRKHLSWWRRLEDVFFLRLLEIFNVLIKADIFALVLCLQETSSRRLGQDQYIRLDHTSSRRLQDLFKTSSRRLQGILRRLLQDVLKTSSSRHLQDVLKAFWRRLQGVFKPSSRHLAKASSKRDQDVLQKCLQEVFKRYHQVKLFLLTRLWDVFSTFLKCTARTVIYWRICLGHTSDKFMVSVETLQDWIKFLKF